MPNNAQHFPTLALVAIGLGAAFGAWLRWWLGLRLNPLFAQMPLGTLAANLLGGYLIGVAISLFDALPAVGPELRLLVITGFLGGLTTFSTFTAEIGVLLQGQRIMAAMAAIILHVCGSLIMMMLGMGTFAFLRSCFR